MESSTTRHHYEISFQGSVVKPKPCRILILVPIFISGGIASGSSGAGNRVTLWQDDATGHTSQSSTFDRDFAIKDDRNTFDQAQNLFHKLTLPDNHVQPKGNINIIDESPSEPRLEIETLRGNPRSNEKIERHMECVLVYTRNPSPAQTTDENISPSFNIPNHHVAESQIYTKGVILQSKEEAFLLMMSRFVSQNESNTCKITISINTCSIEIVTSRESELLEKTDKLTEIRRKIQTKERQFPANICKYIAKKEARRCIQTQLREQRLLVALKAKCENNCVSCLAFSNAIIESAFENLDKMIKSATLQLDVEGESLAQQARKSCDKLVGIYLENNKMEVVSCHAAKLDDTVKNIQSYLKSMVPPKKSVSVTLKNATARCFQNLCYRKLQDHFRYAVSFIYI